MAANRNGGMLRLIASRHDDDDDDMGSLCQRTSSKGSDDTPKRHSAALNCCLFLKVISLKVDEVKLVATSSDILLSYLVISEHFSISVIKCILYFN